jgi:hypothetical protein
VKGKNKQESVSQYMQSETSFSSTDSKLENIPSSSDLKLWEGRVKEVSESLITLKTQFKRIVLIKTLP